MYRESLDVLWAQSILFCHERYFLLDGYFDPSCFLCLYGKGFILLPPLYLSLQSCSLVDFLLQISHLGGLAGLFLFLSFLLPFYFSLACRVLRSGWFIYVVGFGEEEFKFIGWFCISSDNLDARILSFVVSRA